MQLFIIEPQPHRVLAILVQGQHINDAFVSGMEGSPAPTETVLLRVNGVDAMLLQLFRQREIKLAVGLLAEIPGSIRYTVASVCSLPTASKLRLCLIIVCD